MKTLTHIAILGCTGSIGTNTLRVIDSIKQRFKVVALTAGRNLNLLEKQCRKYLPQIAVVENKKDAEHLRQRLSDIKTIDVLWGEQGLIEAVKIHSEIILIATSGSCCLVPLMNAIEQGKRIAIANKEPIVMAGSLVMEKANQCDAQIVPVDSEHSAIFQCLRTDTKNEVNRIYLTASGGPLRGFSINRLKTVDTQTVLSHPTWDMGKKVTVDSATYMNKGLEVIEAMHLFNISPKKIEVVVHPQAIVHSLVEFVDGSVIAQLSNPDMRLPIQYALTFPERERSVVQPMDLIKIKSLTFEKPDKKTFPCLELAYEAAHTGGTLPCVMSVANEIAVGRFLQGQIKFVDIPKIIRYIMKKHSPKKIKSLEDVLETKMWVKKTMG
jgi:1-deoxy-D-xylulose-5-phosphate reductoisomerase